MTAPDSVQALFLRVVKLLATNDVGGSCDQLSWHGIIEAATAIEEGRDDDARLLLETIEQRETNQTEQSKRCSEYELAEQALRAESDKLSEQLQRLCGVVDRYGVVRKVLHDSAEALDAIERELQSGAGGES